MPTYIIMDFDREDLTQTCPENNPIFIEQNNPFRLWQISGELNQRWKNNSYVFPVVDGEPPPTNAKFNTRLFRKIMIDNDDVERIHFLTQVKATKFVDYEKQSLWLISTEAYEELSSQNKKLPIPVMQMVVLGEVPYVPLQGLGMPFVPDNLRQIKTNAHQLWTLQFIGPIKEEWWDYLQRTGIKIEIVQKRRASFLIWIDGESLEKLEAITLKEDSPVQWTHPYHPRYRLNDVLHKTMVKPEDDYMPYLTLHFYKHRNLNLVIDKLHSSGVILEYPREEENSIYLETTNKNKLLEFAHTAEVIRILPSTRGVTKYGYRLS